MTRRNRTVPRPIVTRRNGKNNITQRAQSAKPFIPPQEPLPGTPFIMQTIRVSSVIPVAASTGATVTFAGFLGNINGFGGGVIKLQRLAVYGPSHTADYNFQVTDLLPNNDGLILTDSNTVGAARPSVGWIPTELDRITSHTSSGTVNMFSWTSSVAITGQLVVVATIQLRNA